MVTTKYDGNSGIREHIMMMNDMARKLKGLDMEISEGFLVHFIMTSLSASFEAFKVNYNTQKVKWSMNELIAMCVQEEERLKLDKPDVAYLMTANPKKRKGNVDKKEVSEVQKRNASASSSSKNSKGKSYCKVVVGKKNELANVKESGVTGAFFKGYTDWGVTLTLRSILDKDKLTDSNFLDWQRNLVIVIRLEKKEYVLERAIPPFPAANASRAIKDTYEKHVDDDNEMLQTGEESLTKGKGNSVLIVQGGKGKKKFKKAKKNGPKGKGNNDPKSNSPKLKPKCGVAKDSICHHCGEVGHWKRNCKQYLATKKKGEASASGTEEKK
ncbi:unnamed protein product [Cuscuta campestris]|uniref:CCHC-type domain-containing protein n=1 Tax=Cuscuta campestris TaxID=132261 RepID=A0A484MP56_9ASTE|nr:unnamed protein product [Cuscuta campestris]